VYNEDPNNYIWNERSKEINYCASRWPINVKYGVE